MQLSRSGVILHTFMTVTIILEGYLSPIPWLALCIWLVGDVYQYRFHPQPPVPGHIWQGPHRVRRRRDVASQLPVG
jgi:hypothetical protein